jgi:hypothetical protein
MEAQRARRKPRDRTQQQLIAAHDKLAAVKTHFREHCVSERTAQILFDCIASRPSTDALMEAALERNEVTDSRASTNQRPGSGRYPRRRTAQKVVN